MVKQELTKEEKKIRRIEYNKKFIEKLGGLTNFKRYMCDSVLQTYYRKKLENIDQPQRKVGRPQKQKVDIEEIKKMLKNKTNETKIL